MIEVSVDRKQLKEERWSIIERALQRLQQTNNNSLMDMNKIIVREDDEGNLVFAYEG